MRVWGGQAGFWACGPFWFRPIDFAKVEQKWLSFFWLPIPSFETPPPAENGVLCRGGGRSGVGRMEPVETCWGGVGRRGTDFDLRSMAGRGPVRGYGNHDGRARDDAMKGARVRVI